MLDPVKGFSKLNKAQKIDWICENYLVENPEAKDVLVNYWNKDTELQQLHDEFSENTISNYYMPFGVAPNFLINGKMWALPMAIEESSVVAAASKAAKFWLNKGGFKAKVLSKVKLGHVHFMYEGSGEKLETFFTQTLRDKLYEDTQTITQNMQERGGGIINIRLVDKTSKLANYFQLHTEFETADSMGANFINSCLEQFSKTMEREMEASALFTSQEKKSLKIVMCILSNYTPECIVRAEVSCKISDLVENEEDAKTFAQNFKQAIAIANAEPYRATTHNKGIMNGVDAVVIATGNDFRATEACAHSFAARSGQYKSLTQCDIDEDTFRFWLDLPISLGTVGGLTNLHPLVKVALNLLGKPKAPQLMEFVAVAGLAQNFAALQSLVTTGIQKGHMKMHLFNILNQLGASEEEKKYFVAFFKDKTVSHHLVMIELELMRKKK